MKIDKPSKPLPASPIGEGSAQAANKGSAKTPSVQQQSSSTSVTLGSTATQLQSMENSMAKAPVVNSAKVAEIKQAISEGRFQMNAGVIADRLLETVQHLIGNKA
jgi:negative regulator of flagellin synthesis FlgM